MASENTKSTNRSGSSVLVTQTECTSLNGNSEPSFIILHSNSDTTLAKTSPFLIEKALNGITQGIKAVNKLKSGDLLVETSNPQSSRALLKAKHLAHISITATPHRTLNTCRGVISCIDLLESPLDELLEGFNPQGVTDVKRISLRRDGKEIPTKHLILTFNQRQLPEYIKAGFIRCRVRPYVPNPLRCYNCQRYGHSSQVCRGKTTCPRCSQPGHGKTECQAPVQCVNCGERHPAYSRACPRWREEKTIRSIMATGSISYQKAKSQINSSTKQVTYADVAKTSTPVNAKPKFMVSVAVQTEISCHPSDTFSISLAKVNKSQTTKTKSTTTDHSNTHILCDSSETVNPPQSSSSQKSSPLGAKPMTSGKNPQERDSAQTSSPLGARPKTAGKTPKPVPKLVRPSSSGNLSSKMKGGDRESQPSENPRKDTLRKKSPAPE